jgi:hypothetical protein
MNREEDGPPPIAEQAPTYLEEMAELRCNNPRCSDPGCSAVLSLIPACHPRAGVDVEYHKSDGTVRTACAFCRRPIIHFKVAGLPPERKQ